MNASSTKKMAFNSLWNVLGMTLPMVVGLFAIPPLIHGLGEERFGALTLVWMVVGYFGILDLGMGRALTKLTAERLGNGREDEVHSLFWTAVLAMVGIGLVVMIPVYLGAHTIAYEWLEISPAFEAEAMRAFQVVAWGLPVVVLTVGLIGVLEAYGKFFLVNVLRLPFGTFTFLGPLATLPFSTDLAVMVTVLIAGRCLEILTYGWACFRVAPVLRKPPQFSRPVLIALLSFGGWMTVSNLLLPLMIHIDRFLIGSLLAVAVVAFYTTPAELVVKMLILPRSWVSVLFPQFAAQHERDPEENSRLCIRGLRYLWLIMFPASLLVVAITPEFLEIWLGEEGPLFREKAGPIMQLLALGMYLYAPAYIPYSYLQAIGKPRKAALVHALELPLYLGAAYLLILEYGLHGAAYAWLARAVLDNVLMLGAAWRDLPERAGFWRSWLLPHLLGAAALVAVMQVESVARIGWGAVWVLVGFGLSWFLVLHKEERLALRQRWKRNHV